MNVTNFPAANQYLTKEFEIVEAYLTTKHEGGAVKALCKKHGISPPLILKWREKMSAAAPLAFSGDVSDRLDQDAINYRLRQEVAGLRNVAKPVPNRRRS